MCILCEKESFYKKGRVCNICNSAERQRAFYSNNINILKSQNKILLISPFLGETIFLDKHNINYDISNYFSPTDTDNWNKYCKNESKNVTYVNSLESLDKISDNKYDCVIVFHVIGQLNKDLGCFNSINRVLKNNGIFFYNDPFSDTNNLKYTKTNYRIYPITLIKNILSKLFTVSSINCNDNITNQNVEFIKCIKNNNKHINILSSEEYIKLFNYDKN